MKSFLTYVAITFVVLCAAAFLIAYLIAYFLAIGLLVAILLFCWFLLWLFGDKGSA